MTEPIGFYFHIPFCKKKCDYCHFYVVKDNPAHQQMLLHALEIEWQKQHSLWQGMLPISIYFGGGTPALLSQDAIEKIIKWTGADASAEITLEANPEDATYDKLAAFRQAGINRISFGVQSFDDKLLNTLSRKHSAKKAEEAIEASMRAGIKNISIDLMYELPGQTEASWETTLRTAGSLPITHLSLYNLTIEPHTPFDKKKETLIPLIPSEEVNGRLYLRAVELLESSGLMQYEISAFAKSGAQAVHNTGYWTGRPFLGFGPSAFSYWKGVRYRNIANLREYSSLLQQGKSPVDFSEELPHDARLRELLCVGLRLKQGVDLNLFQNKHGLLKPETYDAIKMMIKEGLMICQNETVALTERGRMLYDAIAAELI